MKINDVEFTSSAYDIIIELRRQLHANGIEYLKTDPRESGNNWQIQCPYHGDGQERKPSAGIRQTDGVFHCFACGEKHDLPEVVSYCFGRNDGGAFGWEWLRRNFLVIEEEKRSVRLDIKRNRGHIRGDKQKSNDSLSDIGGSTKFVSDDELESYRWTHPYWAKRGIVYPDIIELFDLGYDKKTNCITFPVRDIDGNCLFVAKRNVRTKFFHYPEGVKKPLYGLYELAQTIYCNEVEYKPKVIEYEDDYGNIIPVYQHSEIPSFTEIFVCESMIDCILLWQSGYYAVALNGLGNKLQMKQLTDLPCRSLIIATDNDNAGWDAFYDIKKYVRNKIFYRVEFPKGRKDIGEMTEYEIQNLKWNFV